MPIKQNDNKFLLFALLILGLFVAAWYFDWFAVFSEWFQSMNNVLR